MILAKCGYYKRKTIQAECAEEVRRAFDDVKFIKNTFQVIGIGVLNNNDGEKEFYSASSVDGGIDNLNKLIDKWEKLK